MISRPITYLSPGVASVREKSVAMVTSRLNAHLSPGVSSVQGKHIAGECPIPVMPLRRDDFPMMDEMSDNISLYQL